MAGRAGRGRGGGPGKRGAKSDTPASSQGSSSPKQPEVVKKASKTTVNDHATRNRGASKESTQPPQEKKTGKGKSKDDTTTIPILFKGDGVAVGELDSELPEGLTYKEPDELLAVGRKVQALANAPKSPKQQPPDVMDESPDMVPLPVTPTADNHPKGESECPLLITTSKKPCENVLTSDPVRKVDRTLVAPTRGLPSLAPTITPPEKITQGDVADLVSAVNTPYLPSNSPQSGYDDDMDDLPRSDVFSVMNDVTALSKRVTALESQNAEVLSSMKTLTDAISHLRADNNSIGTQIQTVIQTISRLQSVGPSIEARAQRDDASEQIAATMQQSLATSTQIPTGEGSRVPSSNPTLHGPTLFSSPVQREIRTLRKRF